MNTPNRERKGEIKFLVDLDEGQKNVKKGVYDKDVTIILGDFGSGKTYTAAYIALDLLFKKQIKNVYITRPIDFSATGYLTGSASDKLAFHTFPIRQNFYTAYNKVKIDELFAEGVIQIIPIDYMKGMTFVDSCTIVDEFEDISFHDFKLILTRLGKGSKLIYTGSAEQIDIKDSCISKIQCLEYCNDINFHILTSQHRNENIIKILNFIKENEKK